MSLSEASENTCLFVFYFMIKMLLEFLFSYNISLMSPYNISLMSPNDKYLLELIKRRSKVQQKNMSCGRVLNLDQ